MSIGDDKAGIARSNELSTEMPVTWAHIARINAVRWGLLGTGFGLAATAAGWWRERWSR